MKKIVTTLLISMLSTTLVNAEEAVVEFVSTLDSMYSENSMSSDFVALEQEQSDSNLWEILDTDKDGYIDKSEAMHSNYLSDKWDELDTNEDEILDAAEFSQMFYQ